MNNYYTITWRSAAVDVCCLLLSAVTEPPLHTQQGDETFSTAAHKSKENGTMEKQEQLQKPRSKDNDYYVKRAEELLDLLDKIVKARPTNKS